MYRTISLISLGVLLGLAACSPTTSQGIADPTPGAQYTVDVSGAGNRVETLSDAGQVVFSVFSPGGIGSARVAVQGEWPPKILLRLHLDGLENLRLEYAATTIQLSLPVAQPDMALRTVVVAGENETLVEEESSPYWMPVSLQNNEQPDDLYYEVSLPPDFWDSHATDFSFNWIDFYR
jgi:hypothetical protein